MIKRSASVLRFPRVNSCRYVGRQRTAHVPTLDDLITLKSVGGTQISPGRQMDRLHGRLMAISNRTPSSRSSGWLTAPVGKSFQLTRGDKSSTSPRWSPDGKWLAFLSNRIEDRNQIFVIDPSGRRSPAANQIRNRD